MLGTAEGLAAIRSAVTDTAFARIEAGWGPSEGMLSLLSLLDDAVEVWDGQETPDRADHYRLGLLIGILAHAAGCGMSDEGTVEALPVELDDEDPVARAVLALREKVLAFNAHAPG